MSGSRVFVDSEEGVTRISVLGELEIASTDEFQAAVKQCLETPTCTQVRVNLAGVTFCDSTGLGSLVVTRKDCEDRDVEFVLEHPHDRVLRVIELAGLRHVFKIEP